MKKRFKAFTLVELLVSLAVIAIAVTTALTVMVTSQHSYVQDKDLQSSIDFSNNYFSRLYVSVDLKKDLFSIDEMSMMNRIGKFPFLTEPMVTNLSDHIQAIVSRKVRRWSPLLVDIGIEIVITGTDTKSIKRNFWFETTLSENYLKRMI